MFGKLAQTAVGLTAGHPPPPTEWATKLGQCGDGVEMKDWLLSCFCLPCTAAMAKSNMDKTHPLFNFLCFSPIGAYSYTRLGYNIMGECGRDCCVGLFCAPCATRQMYTESNRRGVQSDASANQGNFDQKWKTGLFACTCTELCCAVLCPCCVAHNTRVLLQPTTNNWFDYFCLVPLSMYGQVRNQYGLDTECPHVLLEDICVAAFCGPCALARAQREAMLQKAGPASGILGAAAKYGAMA